MSGIRDEVIPTPEERAAEIETLREAERTKARDRARDAFNRGKREEAEGRLDEASRWLERAHRLARADHAVGFALAMMRLRTGNAAGAILLLLPIARRFDFQQAWIALAIARRAQRLTRDAAHMLEEALGRHVLDKTDPSTIAIATGIARDSGAAGWCGIDEDGNPLVRLLDPATRITVAIDGDPIEPGAIHGHGIEFRVLLGPAHARARTAEISATLDGAPCRLVASRLDLASRRQLDGCVIEDGQGGLTGWAWHPRQPRRLPALQLRGGNGARALPLTPIFGTVIDIPERPLGMVPYGFAVPAAGLPAGPVRICDAEGRDLPGSPIDPGLERRATTALARLSGNGAPPPAMPPFIPVPADFIGAPPSPTRRARPRRVAIVVPAYRDLERTIACLDSLARTVPPGTEIHVVDDASPEPALVDALSARAEAGDIVLHRWADGRNRGFPATANVGLDAVAGQDVVLLNSDTRVAGDWFARLRAAAYRDPATGTATPFTNEGSIFGYPKPRHPNDMPDAAGTARLMQAASRANDRMTVEVPTANGFCMFIRRDCLDDVGGLREDLFAQGYGEENDFCLRARHRGWRHVAALDVYVAHAGGTSFRAGKMQLIARNLGVLNRLHPGYAALVTAHIEADPLAQARLRFDRERFVSPATPGAPVGSVLIVTHQGGGGVERVIRSRVRAIRAEGYRPIVLRGDDGMRDDLLLVEDGGGKSLFPNLRFVLPAQTGEIVDLLSALDPIRIEIHHLLGHHDTVGALCGAFGVPIHVWLHDHAWFCQRITLLGRGGVYCNEPPVATCRACIDTLGPLIGTDVGVDAHLARSASLLASAARIFAPTADTKRRIEAHFPGLDVALALWEPSPSSLPPRRRTHPVGPRHPLTVCVLGAIGPEKGVEVLIACVRDAAARLLPIRYVVVGHTSEDDRLCAAGAAFVTGAYDEDEAPDLIRASGADLAFLPSIWPETWCYTLTECWRAGLDVAAFDLGAQGERITERGGGLLLPLGAAAGAINDAFLARWARPPVVEVGSSNS